MCWRRAPGSYPLGDGLARVSEIDVWRKCVGERKACHQCREDDVCDVSVDLVQLGSWRNPRVTIRALYEYCGVTTNFDGATAAGGGEHVTNGDWADSSVAGGERFIGALDDGACASCSDGPVFVGIRVFLQ